MTELSMAKSREELLQECAPIAYKEIEQFFARGTLVLVSQNTDIIDVALIVQADNSKALDSLIRQGKVIRVHDEHAIKWNKNNTLLMAITAVPWLLVQEIITKTTTLNSYNNSNIL